MSKDAQDLILDHPMDVEDLGRAGRQHDVCPYYAARCAAAVADLVLLPYSALLQEVPLVAVLECMP